MSLSRPRFDAVLFDLDGTLADTIPLIVSSFNAAVAPVLKREFTLNDVIARFGVPDSTMLHRELPKEHWEQAIETYYSHYDSQHEVVKVFDGIAELLSALKEMRLPLGVVTGKGRRAADITLRRLGWQSMFGAVITADEATKPKPAPEGLLQVAQMLKVRPRRCLFIGDSPADMKAGKAAKMTTVAAAWHPVYVERVRALAPDHWANHPREVLPCILGE